MISLEFILVVKVVFFIFRREVQFDGVKTDHLQLGIALGAVNEFAFIHIFVDMNFGITFWASS